METGTNRFAPHVPELPAGWQNDGNASSLPVLKHLYETFPEIMTVLEFGGGKWSTAFSLASGRRVVCMETSQEWADKLAAEHVQYTGDARRLSINVLTPDEESAIPAAVWQGNRGCDLAFIDGGVAENRWYIATALMAIGSCKILVCHDVDADGYAWNRIRLPPGWEWIEVRDYAPRSAVATKDPDVINSIKARYKTHVYTGDLYGQKK